MTFFFANHVFLGTTDQIAQTNFLPRGPKVLSAPLVFAMRYQKLKPRLKHARITQESYKRTVQFLHLFRDSAVHRLLCNNNNITRGPLQLQYSIVLQYASNYLT